MKAKVVEDADVVTYVVVCDPGDEAVSVLTEFARSERLEAAQITAVGAFEHAIVGWFDRAARDYRRIPVDEQCELLSLIGDVAESQDGPILHVHAVLGLSDGTPRLRSAGYLAAICARRQRPRTAHRPLRPRRSTWPSR